MSSLAFAVEIRGIKEMQRVFKKSPQIVEPILQKTIEASQFVLQKNSLKDDPVPWRTGNLLQSFRFFKQRLRGSWMPTASYAVYVHEPRAARGENGKGYAGNPYMEKIALKATEEINDLFDTALKRITEQLAK